MKYTPILFILMLMIQFSSCEKVPLSQPDVIPLDSNVLVTGNEYYVFYTIDGSLHVMKNRIDHVTNSVGREILGSCFQGSDIQFASYFAYASDTSRSEYIAFGLTNCVSDTADGITDSTYMVGSYPMEIPFPDTTIGFIYYMDTDSNFWSSSLGTNGYDAQIAYSFNVDSVRSNFDGTAALEIIGTFSGWIYNGTGDSMLVSSAGYYSKAWAFQ